MGTARIKDKEGKVHSAVKFIGGECGYLEIKDYLIRVYDWGMSRESLLTAMYWLESEGSVEKVGRGIYRYIKDRPCSTLSVNGYEKHFPIQTRRPPSFYATITDAKKIQVGQRLAAFEYPEAKLPHPYDDLEKRLIAI